MRWMWTLNIRFIDAKNEKNATTRSANNVEYLVWNFFVAFPLVWYTSLHNKDFDKTFIEEKEKRDNLNQKIVRKLCINQEKEN
jgi:hypothetical protein